MIKKLHKAYGLMESNMYLALCNKKCPNPARLWLFFQTLLLRLDDQARRAIPSFLPTCDFHRELWQYVLADFPYRVSRNSTYFSNCCPPRSRVSTRAKLFIPQESQNFTTGPGSSRIFQVVEIRLVFILLPSATNRIFTS